MEVEKDMRKANDLMSPPLRLPPPCPLLPLHAAPLEEFLRTADSEFRLLDLDSAKIKLRTSKTYAK